MKETKVPMSICVSGDEYPSPNRLKTKSVVLTEQDCFEMEYVGGMLRSAGVDVSHSEMVRLCIRHAWEDVVKPRLCSVINAPTPSFESK